jgi:hypothetical protein
VIAAPRLGSLGKSNVIGNIVPLSPEEEKKPGPPNESLMKRVMFADSDHHDTDEVMPASNEGSVEGLENAGANPKSPSPALSVPGSIVSSKSESKSSALPSITVLNEMNDIDADFQFADLGIMEEDTDESATKLAHVFGKYSSFTGDVEPLEGYSTYSDVVSNVDGRAAGVDHGSETSNSLSNEDPVADATRIIKSKSDSDLARMKLADMDTLLHVPKPDVVETTREVSKEDLGPPLTLDHADSQAPLMLTSVSLDSVTKEQPYTAPAIKMKRARTLSNSHSHAPVQTAHAGHENVGTEAAGSLRHQTSSNVNIQSKVVARSVGAGLWPYVRQQIFLGIAASSVPVKHDVSDFREDLTNAGVRFIYFSPRNMRRSKPVAEKIGIEFDWNCAISLRDLDGGEALDPHRAISSYGDWDFHAKMPHGVEAIKKHLIEVDNVPLLVSLYTDATPRTIDQMVHVFQDYGEVIMSVGSAYREHNQQIFNSSDVAVSVGVVPGDTRPIPTSLVGALDKFPESSSCSLTKADMLMQFRLIGLSTVSLLQASVPFQETPAPNGNDISESSPSNFINPADAFVMDMMPLQQNNVEGSPELRLSALLTGIRTGRVFLLHAIQCIIIACIFCLSMGVWCVLSNAIPISIPPYLSPNTVILFTFFYLPLILCAVLMGPGPRGVMKSTPRKNVFMRRDEIRFFIYLCIRCAFVVCSTYAFAYVTSISIFTPTNDEWYQWDNHFTTFKSHPSLTDQEPCLANFWFFQDLVGCELLLSLLLQCMTLLERGQSLSRLPTPRSHTAFYGALFVIVSVHIMFVVVRANLRRFHQSEEICYLSRSTTALSVDATLGLVSFLQLNWVVWLLLLLFPTVGLFVGGAVNSVDLKSYERYLKFLRLEFDTRLGMHSPR